MSHVPDETSSANQGLFLVQLGRARKHLREGRLDQARQELEADCYATRLLAEDNRPAVEAALQFFTRMGPFRFDDLHPSGSQRAAKILSCLPAGDR